VSQAEIHLLKSEYAQAMNIYTQIVAMTLSEESDALYAMSLLNIIHIDTIIRRDTNDAYYNVAKAKDIFSNLKFQRGIVYCSMIEACLELR
jgi:hypothetical protein